MSDWFTLEMTLLIFGGAAATYLTRVGGFLLISRLQALPPRLEAALNAVPAAVLTTLVAPAFVAGDTATRIAMAVALPVALRFSTIPMLVAGWLTVLACRHFFG